MAIKKTNNVEFSPSGNDTLMDIVAGRIEALVRAGELRRGDRLPSEPKLAEMLKVSRPSLREALKGLVFLGLLKARAGDGTYLQPSLTSMVSRHFQWMLLLQEINYQDLYELREILEPAAASLAARRATPDDLLAMRTALNGMRSYAEDPEGFLSNELEFHNSIMRASKNVAIQTTIRMMYGALAEGRHRTMPQADGIQENLTRHEKIFSLIAKHDAAGARRAVIEDLKYAEALLRKDHQHWNRVRPTVPARTTVTRTIEKKVTSKVRKP